LTHPIYTDRLSKIDFGLGLRRGIALPMFGDGIFMQDGEEWRRSRNMLQPHLQRKHYEDLVVFRNPVNDLIRIIKNTKGSIDLQPLFFRLTLDTTTAFLFGESAQSLCTLENSGAHTLPSAFDTAQKWVIN
jgi:cytochrome P450